MEPLNLAAILGLDDLDIYLGQVKQQLKRSLSTDDRYLGPILSRLVKNQGKQLRSSLVIAATFALGKKPNHKVIQACVAIELVHLGSLVHDDIIDKSPSRWSRPTINLEDGTAQAIVVGDYLLAQASLQAAEVSQEVAQLVAATITELCQGESHELAELYDTKRTLKSMAQTVEAKTSALISAACQVGGMSVGTNRIQIAALGTYGRSLGIAFQLTDDLLDLISTAEQMGKPVNSDAAAGIYTLPIIFGLNGSKASEIKKLISKPKIPHKLLTTMLIADGSIERTINEIQKYNLQAERALESFSNNKTGLVQLPDAYLKWAANNLVAADYSAAISQFLR